MTPIDRKRLAPSLTSDGQMSLPAEAYAGDSVLRWELEHFFDESWVCVGRSEDLRDAGDRRAVRLGRECVLLERGEGSSLRAFFNVCRHRGHELLEVGQAASGRFVRCPYHAWAYGLDGCARQSYEVAANWKILVENYHECYHCPSIHPELCKVSPPKSGEDHEARGAWVGGSMELEGHAQTMSLTGESLAPMLPHLTSLQQREVYYYQLFPNLLISLHPDYVLTHRLAPLAPASPA